MNSRPSRGLLILLAAMTGLFVVGQILHHPAWLIGHLALIPRRALGPEPWQLLTSAFVHLRLGALISTVIVFWLFGAPLETHVGRGRVAAILLGSTLCGSLAAAGLGRIIAP